MIATLILAAAGFGAMRLVWAGSRQWFDKDHLSRLNHAGRPVPTAAGVLVLPVAALGAAAISVVPGMTESLWNATEALSGDGATATLAAVLGFGVLGLVDDLLGDSSSRGLRGHLGQLGRGRLTTGAAKLIGGAAVALAAVSSVGSSGSMLLIDAALVALAANMANLFDRAPGRCLKMTVLASLLLVAPALSTGASPAVALAACTIGAGLGLARADLDELVMLGDAGANPLGAALGMAAVVTTSATTRLAVAGLLTVLTLAAERASFSRVIDGVALLRRIDRWGLRRSPP